LIFFATQTQAIVVSFFTDHYILLYFLKRRPYIGSLRATLRAARHSLPGCHGAKTVGIKARTVQIHRAEPTPHLVVLFDSNTIRPGAPPLAQILNSVLQG